MCSYRVHLVWAVLLMVPTLDGKVATPRFELGTKGL
jgi:hypothetical protein